jgi:ribonuclease T2
MRFSFFLASLSAVLLPGLAAAQPTVDGTFVASRACPALQSIRRGENPGDVLLKVGEGYRLIARNKVPGTHYWLVVPGAAPERRWVEMTCGTRVEGTGEKDGATGGKGGEGETTGGKGASAGKAPAPAPGNPSTQNLLALSWQASFCERNGAKPECASQTADRPDATRFSLHGLWPQPRGREYCGITENVMRTDDDGRWRDLPKPELSAATRAALERLMPGSQSALDRHEWIRHGSCYGPAEAYFADSVRLVEAVNASPVGALFAGRIGKAVTSQEIRAAFDRGFGPGAGDRVRITCERDGERQIIGEITVGLVGAIGGESDIGKLIRAAAPTKPGCPEGIVDPVGPQ